MDAIRSILVGLSTGIRVQGGFGGKNGSLNNFSSNGGLANANSVLVEGLALDFAQMNAPSFVPPVDATQEFRVQTNTFSAEFGRTSGAVVSMSIKSGTNQFHGSAYEFLRNKSLNANNFFQNRAGNPAAQPGSESVRRFDRRTDQKRQDILLRELGGVPEPQRVAFHYDGTDAAGAAGRLLADTQCGRQCDPDRRSAYHSPIAGRQLYARCLSGKHHPELALQQGRREHCSIYPLPNSQGNPITNVNNYSTVGGGGTNEHQIVNKLDHNLNSRWKLFGTFSRIWADQFNRDPLGYKVNLTRQATYLALTPQRPRALCSALV